MGLGLGLKVQLGLVGSHQLASRLSGQQINIFRLSHTCHVNHCLAIMDIIKKILDTLNQQHA